VVRLTVGRSASWFCIVAAGAGLLITALSLLRPGWQPVPLYVACQVGVLVAGGLGLRRLSILVAAGTFFVLVMAINSGGLPWILYTLHFGIVVVGLVYGWKRAAQYAALPVLAFAFLIPQNTGGAFMGIMMACGSVALAWGLDGFLHRGQALVAGIRCIVGPSGSGGELEARGSTFAGWPESHREPS
jgi:hypothetical protein